MWESFIGLTLQFPPLKSRHLYVPLLLFNLQMVIAHLKKENANLPEESEVGRF